MQSGWLEQLHIGNGGRGIPVIRPKELLRGGRAGAGRLEGR